MLMKVEESLSTTNVVLALLIIVLPLFFVAFHMMMRCRWASAPRWSAIDPAILKVGGSGKKLEALKESVDIVIIGSGLSGLCSAVVLSKAG